MPPIKEGQIYTYDLEAPLGSWDAVTDAGYASKDLCETDWSAILDNWKKQAVNRSEQHGGTFQVELGRMKNARCVATDDPRLVGAN